jgi:hypothetical protein
MTHHHHEIESKTLDRRLWASAALTLLEAEGVAAEVRRFLRDEWNITHATLEAEANGCGQEELLGRWK